ncbi:MAG: DUF4494 domain-containing protein [Prevotellaceae bacterium]|mgnify:CR=1 FL=1|jgi:hypothetical protein|nr:DUF4494 domain-containing protein [Prevotellaceae bacterium]MDY3855490.1 DUF4494 domain-containing protein [Bacteroidaceae bacterium]
MYDWFECKVKYERLQEDGSVKKVPETYLVEAFNFTEAEKRVTEELKPFVKGEFDIDNIHKVKYMEIFDSDVESDDRWYRLKLQFVTLDEKSGKEKKSVSAVLVKANSIARSLENFEKGTKDSVTDFTITQDVETPIMDVFHYGK